MHADTYLLKLQIDYVILDGHGEGPGIPKENFETYLRNCRGIVKSVNRERYTTTKIYLFISTPVANHVMLI